MAGSAAPWIVGGLLVGGGVVLWLRNRAAKAAQEDKGSFCASVAQPLGRLVGFDIPPGACSAIDSLASKVGSLVNDWSQKDADNKRVNGAVAEPMPPDLAAASWDRLGRPLIRGTVARFANGCRPFAGAPGWDKCAPGTHDMLGGTAGTAPVFEGDPKGYPVERAASFSGRPGDAFSGNGNAGSFMKFTPSGNVYIAAKRVEPCAGASRVTRDNANPRPDGAVQWCSNSTGPAGGYRTPGTGPSVGTVIVGSVRTIPAGTVVRDHT